MNRIKNILLRVSEYIGKKILLFAVAISAIVGLTFLFTREFTFSAYSDRLVWAGLFLFLLSGLVWLGVFSAGGQFGVPGSIKKPEEAKKYYAHQEEIRATVEKRYDAAIQIWVIGLACIGIGALVQIVAGRFL